MTRQPFRFKVVNEWSTLDDLQAWVTKNIRSFFGNDEYIVAQQYLRDESVTLVSVELGTIRGTIVGGFGPPISWDVYLTINSGIMSATCNCINNDPSQPKPPTCSHIAALLVFVVDNKAAASPFVCGNSKHAPSQTEKPNGSDNKPSDFNYKAFLATFKTKKEIIELLEHRATDVDRKNGFDEYAAVRGVIKKEEYSEAKELEKLDALFNEVFDIIDEVSIDRDNEEPSGLAYSIHFLLQDALPPYFISVPDGVQRHLATLIEHLHGARLRTRFDCFTTKVLTQLYIDFILSEEEEWHLGALKRFIEVDEEYRSKLECDVDFEFVKMYRAQSTIPESAEMAAYLDSVKPREWYS